MKKMLQCIAYYCMLMMELFFTGFEECAPFIGLFVVGAILIGTGYCFIGIWGIIIPLCIFALLLYVGYNITYR